MAWWTWAAVFVPYAVLAATYVGFRWFPVGDPAVLDLHLRDLLDGGDFPLVGAYSRFGWSHPGPVWFYALAPFHAVGGATAVLIGSILAFGAGLATAVALTVRRYGAGAGAVAGAGVLLAVAAAGSFTVILPWNPHLAFAWFPVFLVLVVTGSDRWPTDLAPALFVGSVLVQLHVGYALLVAAAWGTAALFVLVARRRDLRGALRRAARRRVLWWWAAATVLLWVPPLVEQLRHGSDGNLARIYRYFSGSGAGRAGWRFAAAVAGGAFRFPPVGLGGRAEPADLFSGFVRPGSPWLVAVPAVLVVFAALAAWRAGSMRLARLVVLGAVVLVASVIALSQVAGERWAYLFVWRYVAMWFVVVVSVVAIVAGLVGRRPGVDDLRRRWPALEPAALASVLLALAVLVATFVADRPASVLPGEPDARALTAQLLERPRPAEPVQLVQFGSGLFGVGDGVLDGLDAAGWPVGVPAGAGYEYQRDKYGAHRVVASESTAPRWFVTEGSADTTLLEATPGAETLAKVTPLDPQEDAELARLQLAVMERLVAADRADLAVAVGSPLVRFVFDRSGIDATGLDLDRLAALNRKVDAAKSCRCAVVAVPPDAPDERMAYLEWWAHPSP